MKPKKVIILNNKRQKLVGHFYKNTSKTIVILCPGLDSAIGFPGMDNVFEAYYNTGSSVFVFDFEGFGESEGNKKLSIKQRVADVGSIVTHFSHDYKEIILYGISMSGIVTAIAAAKYKEITKLITINGLFSLNIRTLYPRHAYIVYLYVLLHPYSWSEVLYWKKNFNIEEITIPTLVVYGEKDDIIHPKQSLYFYQNLKAIKNLVTVPNGDHSLMKKEYKKVTIALPNWIKQHVIY